MLGTRLLATSLALDVHRGRAVRQRLVPHARVDREVEARLRRCSASRIDLEVEDLGCCQRGPSLTGRVVTVGAALHDLETPHGGHAVHHRRAAG